jgi:hypothetical protein
MAGMDLLAMLRKRKRTLLCLAIFAYLCFIVRIAKDPPALVVLVGVGILFLILFYPSKDDPTSKPPNFKPRKRTKNFLWYR